MNMIRKNNQSNLIIFDLFGVVFTKGLNSSINQLSKILNRSIRDVKIAYEKWEYDFDRGQIDNKDFWYFVNSELRTNISSELLTEIVISSYELNEQTINLIDYLSSHCKIVAYSNFRHSWFEILEQKFNVSKIFSSVYISSKTGILKPSQNVFYYLQRQHGVKIQNMVLIDDNEDNIHSMINFGGNGVLFRNIYEAEPEIRRLIHGSIPPYDYIYSGILLKSKDNNFILQKRDKKKNIINPNKLSVFGGKSKHGENPLNCAIRELKEETTLSFESNDFRFLQEFGFLVNKKYCGKGHYFLVEEVDVDRILIKEGQGYELWKPELLLDNPNVTDIPKILISNYLSGKYRASRLTNF